MLSPSLKRKTYVVPFFSNKTYESKEINQQPGSCVSLCLSLSLFLPRCTVEQATDTERVEMARGGVSVEMQ
jgi:hypothetical protein